MGRYAKTMILLLLLVYLEPFIARVKGLDHSASSANLATKEGMIQVHSRKLIIEVDTQKDYSPGANPKHEPPPRAKAGAYTAGGRS